MSYPVTETCHDCGVEYPYPVGHHHDDEECAAAVRLAKGATLLFAIHLPGIDFAVNLEAEDFADQMVDMVNEERARNGGPGDRVTVNLWPQPQWLDGADRSVMLALLGLDQEHIRANATAVAYVAPWVRSRQDQMNAEGLVNEICDLWREAIEG